MVIQCARQRRRDGLLLPVLKAYRATDRDTVRLSGEMKTIGKYIIRALLGRGAMGKVFKVEHPTIGKVAALKLLDPDPLLVSLIGTEKIREMFIAEALKLASLSHPNVVDIIDFDESNDRPFYLMAYHVNNLGVLIGESHRPDEPSRQISIDKAIHYTRHTLQGLTCLHYAGIIHRDIKPFNLLITDQDIVKICDFGLSKLHGEKFAGPATLKVGSPWYAAPEQETDPDQVTSTADLYSVGVTFYRMLTGVLPAEDYHPVTTFNADLDQSWDDFICRAIAHNANDRFSSATDMLLALGELERAWQNKKKDFCLAPAVSVDRLQSPAVSEAVQFRSYCIKIDPRSARELLAVDRLWRPLVYCNNDFKINRKKTIIDAASGLMWQQAGSAFPMSWRHAGNYVEQINAESFAGQSDWRLPTISELMTLLTGLPTGNEHCIEPIFDPEQKWIWSCDRRSFTAAWFVSSDLGFVAWQDFSAYFYVRAVRNLL